MRASSSSAYGSGRPWRAASAATRGSSSARASSSALGLASCGSAIAPSPALAACTRSTASAATNEPEPGRVSITPWTWSEAIASRTEERPTSEPLRQVALGRQALAGLQQPHADLAGDPIGDPLVELAWP